MRDQTRSSKSKIPLGRPPWSPRSRRAISSDRRRIPGHHPPCRRRPRASQRISQLQLTRRMGRDLKASPASRTTHDQACPGKPSIEFEEQSFLQPSVFSIARRNMSIGITRFSPREPTVCFCIFSGKVIRLLPACANCLPVYFSSYV